MIMLFPKEKTLLLLSSALIILLCTSVSVLSVGSGILTIQNTGTITTHTEYPSSTFTYRIFQNSTSKYRINSMGSVDDDNANFAIMLNNALSNCSALGGGSIYVYPDNYVTDRSIGFAYYASGYSNVYLQFGPATNITRTSGTGSGDYIFQLHSYGTTTNFTLTSNGTVTFNAANYCDGFDLNGQLNSTFSNMTIEHLKGNGMQIAQSRYCHYENITVFSPHETTASGWIIMLGDVQYSTFKHLNLDGNNQGLTEGFYFGDWYGSTYWNGTCFNSISDVWVHNMIRNGFYLNSGGTGFGVYNNTFTNCTAENNAQNGYFGIKLRPAQNNTFTNIIIKNMTGGVTTGTSYDDGETPGNCTGNFVQATCYNIRNQPFTLTTDGNDQSVDHNFFNLTFSGGPGTYFNSGENSPIHDNTAYLNFTDTSWGIYLEEGYMSQNTFYLNFTRCGSGGHTDIWHYSTWTNITNNTFNVYATSGNPKSLYDFTNGTQGNIVVYPYS